jgi:hypothetical protein
VFLFLLVLCKNCMHHDHWCSLCEAVLQGQPTKKLINTLRKKNENAHSELQYTYFSHAFGLLKKNYKVWSKIHTKQGSHCISPKLHSPSNSQNRHPVPTYHISFISTQQFADKMCRSTDRRHDLPSVSLLYVNAQIIKLHIYILKLSGWLNMIIYDNNKCVS